MYFELTKAFRKITENVAAAGLQKEREQRRHCATILEVAKGTDDMTFVLVSLVTFETHQQLGHVANVARARYVDNRPQSSGLVAFMKEFERHLEIGRASCRERV
mgnify:CR=1 FL=1